MQRPGSETNESWSRFHQIKTSTIYRRGGDKEIGKNINTFITFPKIAFIFATIRLLSVNYFIDRTSFNFHVKRLLI